MFDRRAIRRPGAWRRSTATEIRCRRLERFRAAELWKVRTAMKTFSRFVLALFMDGAGAMHFISPEFYLKIVPPYLP
jgi:hypothetical protein